MNDISEEIIIRAAQRDIDAFESIYKATASFVYNIAKRIVGKNEDAQEGDQEVFLIVYRKLKNFRFKSSLKTWLYRITTNYAINFAKKESMIRNKRLEYDDMEIEITGQESKSIEEAQEMKVSIDTLLAVLPPEQRACIVLRSIEGLSYQAIAEILKININTVRSRLNRAREKMMAFRKQVKYGEM